MLKLIKGISLTNKFINVSKFHSSPVLFAEPLKKKKKIDPAVIKQREERRKKKIEKQIRRLEKNARQLKPIDELEVPLHLLDEQKIRSRTLEKISSEELEERILLNKKWAYYKQNENMMDYKTLDKLVNCQFKALQELRLVSEDLYQEAIKPDISLVPYKAQVPVETPPKSNYPFVDGDYNIVGNKWK